MNSKRIIPLLSLSLLLIAGCNGSSTGSNDQYKDGYRDGYEDGYNDAEKDFGGNGYDVGYSEGYNEGYEQGKEDAKEEEESAGIRPGKNIDIHTEKQAKFLAGNPTNISAYADGTKEMCAPNTFTLNYGDVKFAESPTSYKVRLSEKEDFSTYKEFETTDTSVDITNLKLNTKYYWYAAGQKGSTTYTTQTFTFSTKDTILRNIYVPGTSNWRDLGNYKTSDGKIIKQGLIYRSAAFGFYDGTTSSTIAEETQNVIKNELGIKTDIDLTGATGIEGINRLYYRMEYSGISNLIDDDGNKAAIQKVFTALGDENNYPAVFHCTRGRDRTGAIAFLLGGYLGMDKTDLYRDYCFTNFSSSNYCSYGVINNYISYLNSFEGSGLQQKIESYLLSIGVTSETLTNINAILK